MFTSMRQGRRERSGERGRGRRRVLAPRLEWLEERVALAVDFAMVSATTTDSRSVEVSYRVDGDGGSPFAVGIYRSADANFDASDVPLATQTISTASGTAAGTHDLTVAIPGGLGIDPSHPYVLAVANPGNTVTETNSNNDLASFRIYVIGAISHGTDPAPLWEPAMAQSLKAEGYDRVVPFFWITQSILPLPGQAVAAGRRMASQIIAAAHTLPAGSIIDLHLIGHSRGGVVISQAMQTIQTIAQAGSDAQLKGVLAGWTRMTFLDPHPAHNTHTTTTSTAQFFSASPGPLGQLGKQLTFLFQAAMRDPEAFAPSSVDQAEVFFQHAPYYAATDPLDHLFNIWGETPVAGATRYIDLTGIANGHYVLPYWYEANVVPTLRTGAAYNPPSPNALPAAPTAKPLAVEARILYSLVGSRANVDLGLLSRASSAESAFRGGNTRQGVINYVSLLRYAIQQQSVINPDMLRILRVLTLGVARLR